MIRSLLKFISIILILSSTALADKIEKITISGNKRISEESIKVLGDISIKKN